MSWVSAAGFARRPLVFVEDQLHHVGELLAAIAESDRPLLAQVTAVCLDRPGPDTSRYVERWLAAYPEVQLAAAVAEPKDRLRPLKAEVFAGSSRYCKEIAALLRPGGLLVQDVQLSTLTFLPEERWWESIFLASTVRGMFAVQPPAARFLSNKRGYEATFGRDLLDAGFDPRDVMDKEELAGTVIPVLRGYLDRSFPWRLQLVRGAAQGGELAMSGGEGDAREVEEGLDLVLWRKGGAVELAGRLVGGAGGAGSPGERRRLSLRPGSHEARTWCDLVEDRLAGGSGIAVVEVGKRVAPVGADRAELTNLAARHVHGLRARLSNPGALLTVDHAYRLDPELGVGRVGVPSSDLLQAPPRPA
jgi:hypothetical protein